jgi:hypothetical protein
VIVHGDDVHVPVRPPGFATAVYPLIGEPPETDGGVKFTSACRSPPVTVPIVGAPGATAGVTVADAPDAGEVPAELVAVTVNVYGMPCSARPRCTAMPNKSRRGRPVARTVNV